jgi:hypothetical protein
MKTISIAGQPFELSTPYTAGYVISEIEAKVLNQTRAENIGNNLRAEVKKAVESGSAEELEKVRAALAKADAEYQFSAGGGGTARTPIDPIEAEAFRIAKDVVKVKIHEKTGLTVKKYLEIEGNEAKYEAAVEAVAAKEDTLKLAKQRVAAKKKALDSAGDDLGLA